MSCEDQGRDISEELMGVWKASPGQLGTNCDRQFFPRLSRKRRVQDADAAGLALHHTLHLSSLLYSQLYITWREKVCLGREVFRSLYFYYVILTSHKQNGVPCRDSVLHPLCVSYS